MTALSISPSAMAVMGIRVAIETDAYPDFEFIKKLQVIRVEQDAVGLKADSGADIWAQCMAYCLHGMPDEIFSGEQWFTAMQDQLDRIQRMIPNVLNNPAP